MRHRLLLLLLMLVPCAMMMAQVEKPIRVKGRVTVHNRSTEKDGYEAVYYALMPKSEAQRAHADFKRLTGDDAGSDASMVEHTARMFHGLLLHHSPRLFVQYTQRQQEDRHSHQQDTQTEFPRERSTDMLYHTTHTSPNL